VPKQREDHAAERGGAQRKARRSAGGLPSFTRAALALPAGLPIDAPLRGAPSSLETEANRGISVNREALDEMARETYVIWQKICIKEPCPLLQALAGRDGSS
jgi:hypothetical protein